MTSRINAEWHQANRMPKNPTAEQRFRWHLDHSKNCSCREMSPKLKQEIADWQTRQATSSEPKS
jgi:hypothetical protein